MDKKAEGYYLSEVTQDGIVYQAVMLQHGAGVPLPIFRLGIIDHRKSVVAQSVFRLFKFLGWVKMLAVLSMPDQPDV